MSRTITVVDYGMGNLASVANAVEYLGHAVDITSDPDRIARAEKLVVPGVGAFCTGMNNIKARGLEQPILSAAASGAHLLGICLGMQMFMQRSFEFGIHEGLSLIDGEVREIDAESYGLRLPHIGWNDAAVVREHPVVPAAPDKHCFYFVNSYACFCDREEDVVATYDYGARYAAVVTRNNVVGVQFHPEKSQTDGLALLRRFIDW